MSVADFAIGGFYCNCFANPQIYKTEEWAKVLDKFPAFKLYGENYSTEMETYLLTRMSAVL
jgi:hypothetical protein